MAERLVVIGNGMVGHKFVQTLCTEPHGFRITVFCEEPHLAYDRVHLSHYFRTPRPDLSLADPEAYRAWGVEVIHARAEAIDRAQKVVRAGNLEVPYDLLVLATGSRPFVPPIEGRELEGCFVYRTLEDLARLEAYAQRAQVGVVVGGGLLGLEAAGALQALGLKVHVVEVAPRLLLQQVDELGGKHLLRHVRALGIEVHLGTVVQRIWGPEGRVEAIEFADRSRLEADLVVFATGIRPRDELARQAGLQVGERGGVVIDDHCRTSDPHIYAIGECAMHRGRIYGLVGPGYQMAKVLAEVLLGRESRFTGGDTSTQLKLLGVEVASFGDAMGETPGATEVIYTDFAKGLYKKLVLSADGRLLGGILVGDATAYPTLRGLLGEPLEHPEKFLVPPGGASPLQPAHTRVCNCLGVSREQIREAVRAGARDLTALKKATQAGTGCGGCVPAIKSILQEELRALGEAVSHHLCEHFPFSRAELYDIIRVMGYRTFDEVLKGHGRGLGCEVCKPAVASILASLHNEHILKDEHLLLQDTNDRFLANIQRDGTYSVVPRIPGGEITPDKLMVIATVAKKYGLYVKITGGQRIDLFGAQLHQLPQIWAELVAAGFESGHAYGKALRTVKSCVGSTWCRYGVQDSVGLAIRLENRYKGLRAPHKIKAAVSGCVRECAEARGKDFGVIATERGWNLYVCGNGGMKPRHADLLATDLDEETLIRYIDRFLMFYIRTADHLERTSTWLERLEGGIEYLRQVIVEDKLGIGAELEAQMAKVVASYQDEWAATLKDPEKLKRFCHFVNSNDPDENIVRVEERGQYRPAYDFERLEALPMAQGGSHG